MVVSAFFTYPNGIGKTKPGYCFLWGIYQQLFRVYQQVLTALFFDNFLLFTTINNCR